MIFNFKQSFRKQLEGFRPSLYKIAWSWCHNAELADDLVQETYVKALRNRSQLKDSAKLKPWLTRILVNLHMDYLRTTHDQVALEDEYLCETDDPENQISRVDNIQRVRNAIAKLNEKHRKIITLIDLADFSYVEVAEILDVPVGTVMSRLNRARTQLKSYLQFEHHDEGLGRYENSPEDSPTNLPIPPALKVVK